MNKMIEMLGKMNVAVEHSATSKWIKPITRKLKIGRFVTYMKGKTDNKEDIIRRCEEYREFYDQHRQDFEKIPELLEDDFSRYTLERVLEFRKTWNMDALKDVTVDSEYFQKDIFGPVKDEVFIDGGAYVGDTVEKFIKNFAGGGYKKIYAWEPDEDNVEQLKKNTAKYNNVEVVPCGMWREKSVLHFEKHGDTGSKFVNGEQLGVQQVNVDSIDDVCIGEKVTFIKMDIEGSELAALQGAVKVITRDKPRMAICVYHKPEDLYELPRWIKRTVPEYKLYIRHHGYRRATSTVLYAVIDN